MQEGPNHNKRRIKKNLITGSVVAILIAVSPYIFYLHEAAPEEPKWSLWLFTIESEAYGDVSSLMWIFMLKFVPLFLLVLWFFTCKHWWYHVILIPIAMYAFQIFSVVNAEAEYVDEVELIYIVPIMMVIIPFVYLIRLKIFDKVVHGIDIKQLDEELERLKDVEDYHDESLELD